MESKRKQIICVSTSPWHPVPTRKQQVMSRLQNADILYFDPPVTYIARFKDKEAAKKARAYKKPGEKIGDNITVYSLPPVLPFFNKFRFINRLNQKKIASFIGKKLRENGMVSPILWTYSPTSADLVDRLAYRYLVYDCVDRHSAYKGFINRQLVDGMEAELAKRADVVFATADGLAETLMGYNERTYLIPNGANYELFSQAQASDLSLPYKLLSVPGPIFGFVGALQECVDYELVIHAAKQRPDWSFVFVGREQPGVVPEELKALNNVHLLGLVPHKTVPNYISRFDVCLNLFRTGRLARDVSPLKFYEYLATGKPIVSTRYPMQVQAYEDGIYITSGVEDFVEKCRQALEEDTPEKRNARIDWGRDASWDARVAQISSVLRTQGIFD